MKKAVLLVIRSYQRVFSPDQGFLRHIYRNKYNHCLMYPTCSEYMVTSVEKHGVIVGVSKGVGRILRCHPYQKNFVDLP